jgi:hypothetical protein
MQFNVNLAYFGEAQPFRVAIQLKAALSIGETIIATIALEAGIAGCLPPLDPAKKGLESQVHPLSDFLQDLTMDQFEGGTFSFEYR